MIAEASRTRKLFFDELTALCAKIASFLDACMTSGLFRLDDPDLAAGHLGAPHQRKLLQGQTPTCEGYPRMTSGRGLCDQVKNGRCYKEVGFGRASMSDICERIGGSNATLYNYFPQGEAAFLVGYDRR
jgi:hypothetical protein